MTREDQPQKSAILRFFIGLSIFGLIVGFVFRLVQPFWHAYRINNWLKGEPHYINEYSRTLRKDGYFKFNVELSGEDGPELLIENVHWKSPVRIEARKDLDPAIMSNLTSDDNEFLIQRRRNLQSSIEAVLSSSPGIFSYQDRNGNAVGFENADAILMEYRIYPDGLSQHELISGIVGIANALLYVDRREQLIKDEIQDQM